MQGVGRCLAQGAGQQDGTVQAAGETRDGAGRINDDQAGIQVTDEGGQVVQVLGESVRARAGEGQRRILDEGTHERQMGGIAPSGFEARFEDIGGRVVEGQEDNVTLVGGRAVGQGRAAGDGWGAGGLGDGCCFLRERSWWAISRSRSRRMKSSMFLDVIAKVLSG